MLYQIDFEKEVNEMKFKGRIITVDLAFEQKKF